MLQAVLSMRIDDATFLVSLYALAAALGLYLVVRPGRLRRSMRMLGSALVGGAAGYLLVWLVSDVWNVFGLPLTPVTKLWVSAATAGLFLAVANLWRSRWWRKAIALLAIPVFLASAASGVNMDYGAYRTLRDALGITPFTALPVSFATPAAGLMDPHLGQDWTAPRGMPKEGKVFTTTIPATVSHFPARKAMVYLPPAARVADPPVLPVVVLMAGQPGSPADVFTSGRAAHIYNRYAAAHNGLAPIVVAPDQLGNPSHNPMCVDSPLGDSATYMTVDVPHWVRSRFRVAKSPAYWAVGGYSQGGTCAVQFGTQDPQLFGSFISILGEIRPADGRQTVAQAFHGSEAAYRAVQPLHIMKKKAPYRHSWAVFATGVRDVKYTRWAHDLDRAARRAGIRTRFLASPHSGHDWNTVRYVLDRTLPQLADRMGLGR